MKVKQKSVQGRKIIKNKINLYMYVYLKKNIKQNTHTHKNDDDDENNSGQRNVAAEPADALVNCHN